MFQRIDRTRNAAMILANRNDRSKGKLIEAANQFWAAMFNCQQWPSDLRRKADCIVAKIMADGPIEPAIENMDEATANEVAENIVSLASDLRESNVLVNQRR